MRIAVLTSTTVWGGLEGHTIGLLRTLKSAGDDVYLACLGTKTAELYRKSGLNPDRLLLLEPPPARENTRTEPWETALRPLKNHTVIYQKATFFAGGLALDRALARLGAYVAIEHCSPPRLPEVRRVAGVPLAGLWWHAWKWRGSARLRGPTKTICVSEAQARALEADYRPPDDRLVVIHNGIETSRYVPEPTWRDELRTGWGISEGTRVVGFVGRLAGDKGVDVALRAFAKVVATEAIPVHFVVVGNGREQDALEQLASTLGIGHLVTFAGFSWEPWKVYAAFDEFVLPSRMEAFSLVLMEALSAGAGVIASRVGGVPELLENGIGTMVPPGDVDALAEAMRAHFTQPREARELASARGRAHVQAHFEMRTQHLKIRSVLEGLQGDRRARAV